MRELLLASLGGRQYGMWKDAILSVRDIHALHRIPLSPPRIAGIMIDDGTAVTLADLSACLGYEPSRAADHGCILLMADGGKVAGFAVNGELRTQPIPPESIFPLPDYLKTSAFDACAVHDGIPIPIINIAELYSLQPKTGKKASGFSNRATAAQPRDISRVELIRFFIAAGKRYAASITDMDEKAARQGSIAPLPGTPEYVKGVTFRDGRLLSVIDLTRRIERQSSAPDAMMLTARIADAAFGFLVDCDDGTLPADKVSIKPAPWIARSPWLQHLAVRDGELVPLVDLAMAIAADSADKTPIWQHYATASVFPDVFFRHEVEVVEFSLLGVRHALPKVEVEEVVAFKPCRVIPDTAPIVTGVAEHNGEILPVVDLAMMFGRRSIATPDWRMMLVNNGDFRALVIAESVFGERRLPLDMHRTMPIHLPHKLMYGCYPDGNAVRIILNVAAISMHFEKSMVQKFMPALSDEMRMSPAGVVYTFSEENAGPVEKTGPEERVGKGQQLPENAILADVEAEPIPETAPIAGYSPAEPGFEQQAGEEAVEWTEADLAASAIAVEPDPVEIAGKAEFPAGTQVPPARTEEGSDATAFELEHIQPVSEQMIAPEILTTDAEAVEHISRDDVPHREPSGKGGKARKISAAAEKTPLQELKAAAKKKRKQQAPATAAAEGRLPEPMRTMANTKSGGPYRMIPPAVRPAISSHSEVRAAGKNWKRSIAYGAIAAMLMVVFYFSGILDSGTSGKPVVGKSPHETGPAQMGQALVRPGQSRPEIVPGKADADQAEEHIEQAKLEAEQARDAAQAERDARARDGTKAVSKREPKRAIRQTLVLSPLTEELAEPQRAEQKARASLELDIPKNRPTDIDVYVVQAGDTLWSISERFTGSPYNYPRIAGENRIAEPDLIFPGQKIRLIK